MGAELLCTDRQTDTDTNIRNRANVPNNGGKDLKYPPDEVMCFPLGRYTEQSDTSLSTFFIFEFPCIISL